MKTKKYFLKESDFLNWYFADNDDYKHIGRRVQNLLEKYGTANISTKDLFEEQEEVPSWLLESYEEEEEEENEYINTEFIELIKD